MRPARIALPVGLRPRILAALLLTGVATLAVAAFALLSPLEQRLRATGVTEVLNAAAISRTELSEERLQPATGLPEPEEMTATIDLLRRGISAQGLLLNAQNEIVSHSGASDFDVPAFFPVAHRALAHHRAVHTFQGDLLLVAEPLRIGGHPFVLVVIKHLDYLASAVSAVESAFLEAAAAGLVIALLLGITLSRTLVRRLRQLRDAARGIERSGLDRPLELEDARDEIGELARTMHGMQTRLKAQDAALRAFIANASHELRTPLASLDGLLELIADDLDERRLDLVDARSRTERARQQARRLSALAGDLLDISRIDAGMALRSEPVELIELTRAIVAELDARANSSGVQFRTNADAAQVWALGDPGALARIVRLLLDNALRVSSRGGAIEIDILVEAEGVRLTVRDHGPGVPQADRELIFERFRRGATATGRGGFGLGLAIGRELAEHMGGRLALIDKQAQAADAGTQQTVGGNKSPEVGAEFSLSLPRPALDAEAGAAPGEPPATARH